MSRDANKDVEFNLRQLSQFITLANHGSLSAAAHHLNISQPSLSSSVSKLERHLGVRLAERGPRGSQLTAAGKLVTERGSQILENIRALMDELQEMEDEPRGMIALGLPPSLSRLLSVPLLETVYNERPNLRLRITEALSADIIDWIMTDRLDLGYVYEIPSLSLFHVSPVLQEQIFLIVARDDWAGTFDENGKATTPVSLMDVSKLPLVMTSKNAEIMSKRLLLSHGFKLNIVGELDSLPHILEMVGRGSAYTLMPRGAVFEQVSSGQIGMVPILEKDLDRKAYLVTLKSKAGTKANSVITKYVSVILTEMISRYQLEAELIS